MDSVRLFFALVALLAADKFARLVAGDMLDGPKGVTRIVWRR